MLRQVRIMDDENEEERRLLRRETPELERLTDLIFGLALSIGALVLISKPPRNVQEILIDAVSFSYSFFILMVIWIRYTAALSFVKAESPGEVRLNFILLFLVSMEPYFFFLLASGPEEFVGARIDDVASILYALDLGALMAILAFFSDRIIRDRDRSAHPSMAARHGVYRTVFYSSAAILLLSALPIFWNVLLFGFPLRYYLWAVPVVLIVAGGLRSEREAHRR